MESLESRFKVGHMNSSQFKDENEGENGDEDENDEIEDEDIDDEDEDIEDEDEDEEDDEESERINRAFALAFPGLKDSMPGLQNSSGFGNGQKVKDEQEMLSEDENEDEIEDEDDDEENDTKDSKFEHKVFTEEKQSKDSNEDDFWFGFKCPTCGKYFSTKQFLKIHVEKIHKGSKIIPCTMCDKVFIGENGAKALKNHMKTVHEMPAFQFQPKIQGMNRTSFYFPFISMPLARLTVIHIEFRLRPNSPAT